jgi:DNA-binding transcriptional MerR regulator/uncharacterized RmlC-like cupin family protein
LPEAGYPAGFSIGEVAEAIGVAAQTLRLWERERLVSPGRTGRGYRVYTEEDVERLKRIKRLRVVEGLNFAAIRQRLGPAVQNGGGEPDERPNALGEQLRRLRVKSRKTLREVSEETGLSISFISALERGESGASVASLRRLADVYRVTLREIFGADLKRNTPLVRKHERPRMQWENGVRFEEMIVGESVMDPSFLYVPPHRGSEGFYSHTGEEFIYLLSGVLHVELKDRGTYRLEPGDTLFFPSTTPHRWWTEDEPAEAVYVNTPPTF